MCDVKALGVTQIKQGGSSERGGYGSDRQRSVDVKTPWWHSARSI